jgi:hypothetical protein
MDNVSDWWPGYSDRRYRSYWVRTIGLSAADDTLLTRYAKLRERYFDKRGQSNEDPATSEGGLFTARATLAADPIGDAFIRDCPVIPSTGRLGVIEEPLAVVLGNMLFTRTFRRERYRYAKRWYGDDWVDLDAKLLFSPTVDAFEHGGRITDTVAEAVQLCETVRALRQRSPPPAGK